jgi:hypothetical protein
VMQENMLECVRSRKECLYHINFVESASCKLFHATYRNSFWAFLLELPSLYTEPINCKCLIIIYVFSFVWTRIDASGLQLTDVRSPVPARSRDPVTSLINYCALEYLKVAGVHCNRMVDVSAYRYISMATERHGRVVSTSRSGGSEFEYGPAKPGVLI